MTTFLIVLGALVLGAIGGGLLAWLPLNNAFAVARAERRAAQYELANQIAGHDRYVKQRDEQQAKDDAEYNALYEQAEQFNADADAWWQESVKADAKYAELLEFIRERGMHEAAVAGAHDAEVVDPFDVDLPALREIEAAVPVSPAPIVTWEAPTGSWAFAGGQQALAATPARIGKHRADEMAVAA